MDFAWSPEQLALKQGIVAFARRELNIDLDARDRNGTFCREIWRACAQFGIQGLYVPEAYGGQGRDLLTTILAMEGLGYGCLDNGLTFALSGHMWSVQAALLEHGSEQQKRRYLPPICRGEVIGCYGMTEPEAGSDAYSITTRATRVEGGYVLNGRKMLITFAPIADFAIIFATVDPSKRQWGITAFLVDRGNQGFSSGPVDEKMGLRTVPLGTLALEECFVPEENRLGAEGAGASIFGSSQEFERGCILANQIGVMERQLELCLDYARRRQAFGQTIGKFQAIGHRLAEMKLRLETARLLLYKAAWQLMHDQPAMMDAALANLYVGEAVVQSGMDALRIYGGRGYLREYGLEREMRDAMAAPIYGGTSDIQRTIIARLLGV